MFLKRILRICVLALFVGLIGGLGIYYGVSRFPERQTVPQSVALSRRCRNVNNQSQAERAFQTVRSDVVSVINLKSGQSVLSDWLGLPFKTLDTHREGSGIIYQARGKQAYIVTNHHVVSGAEMIRVILSNGHQIPARLVGDDNLTDLAVLKVNSNYIHQIASFGNSNQVNTGEPALAIGSPLSSSYASSLTRGIVSAKRREVPRINHNGRLTGDVNVIQTDAAINQGNSGGPLINLAGQVIGINSMKISTDNQGIGVEKIGFSIPSNEVVRIINQIVKHGRVIRPKLGIEYLDLSEIPQHQQRQELKLPPKVTHGSVIAMVKPHSSAARAGLKKGDVVTSLAGHPISGLNQLRSILYDYRVGDVISVTYYQQGQLRHSKIKLTS